MDRNELVMMTPEERSCTGSQFCILSLSCRIQNWTSMWARRRSLRTAWIRSARFFKIFLVRFDTTYVARIDTIINSSTGDTTISIIRRDTSYFSNHDLINAPTRIVCRSPEGPSADFPASACFRIMDISRPGRDLTIAAS